MPSTYIFPDTDDHQGWRTLARSLNNELADKEREVDNLTIALEYSKNAVLKIREKFRDDIEVVVITEYVDCGKIQAIKLARELLDLGLKEAKDFVEEIPMEKIALEALAKGHTVTIRDRIVDIKRN